MNKLSLTPCAALVWAALASTAVAQKPIVYPAKGQSAQQQPAWQRYVREQPRIKPFTDMLAYGRPPNKLGTWTEVTTALGQGIEAAVTQKMTPKQALDDAARAAEPFIKDG